MGVPQQLTDTEWLLLTTPDDTEEAPWMVNPGFQSRIVALLVSILRRYARRQPQPWYIEPELKVVMPRQIIRLDLDLGPDLLLAQTEDVTRDSWDLEKEGGPPFLVIEVVTKDSRKRDLEAKPRLYEQMGVQEYLIFDPRRARGARLSGYRRNDQGRWLPWLPDQPGQLHSAALGGLWFFEESGEPHNWLRVRDGWGNRLLSDEEAAQAAEERAESEAARAEREAARAEREATARALAEERAAAALAELERLRALRGQPPS